MQSFLRGQGNVGFREKEKRDFEKGSQVVRGEKKNHYVKKKI